ncbi:MAG: zinc ribbon domain-containing protein [Anaerolineae bacterium]|nr:zinc ribbon domain-containing protein [Anaerolineae bacterium]
MAELLGISEDVALIITVYGVVIVAAFWLAMIVWAYRDMRARSRDLFAQLGVALLVALLTVPGLLIYLLLRPRETLGEAYERSLEEEALLQEIEEKPTCPGCGQRTQVTWQACPHCFTRLKKPCVHCRQLLELSWQVCPYCTTPQVNQNPEPAVMTTRYVRPSSVPETSGQRAAQALEFVDGDDM